jgi:molybdopterin converting factor small subunit
MPQTVRVNYYAQLREALKTTAEVVSLELPAREGDLLEQLARLHPRQRDLFLASRVAVNEEYVDGKSLLEGLTDVDIISPISGG